MTLSDTARRPTPEPAGKPAPEPAGGPARWLVGLARAAARVFFRDIERDGLEHIEDDRPLVLVANHVNALVDPVLLYAALPRAPHFLGKSTLWDVLPLRPFLAAAAAIPVYRRQDTGDTGRNEEMFAASRAVLGAGGAIALFPEGISHDAPALAPLRTGAARIALDAAAAGNTALRIVPVGLVFDAKGTFRSRALVHIGAPLDPKFELALHATDPIAAARDLTARIDAALRTVTLNYASHDDAHVIERAADLWSRRALSLPRPASLAAAAALRRAFADGHAALLREHPERVAAVRRAVERYDRILSAFGLRDEHVVSTYPWRPVARFLARTAGFVALTLPLAVVGLVLNVLPYLAVRTLARRFAQSEDMAATVKVFAGLLLYPLAWATAAFFVGRSFGAIWGLLLLLVAPGAGVVAQLSRERLAMLRRETRAFLLLRTQESLGAEIRARRDAVHAEVEGLARLLAARA